MTEENIPITNTEDNWLFMNRASIPGEKKIVLYRTKSSNEAVLNHILMVREANLQGLKLKKHPSLTQCITLSMMRLTSPLLAYS